jgi:APA family basic amino acid/polyamine antiporter
MIGSGIFIVSADIARNLGSQGWLLVVWAITGVMTVMAALSYGELASMFPHAGGVYVYLREAFSPLFGFLYGWTLFMVIQCGTIAAIAVAFAKYSGVLFPVVSPENILVRIGGFHINTTQLVAVAIIIFLSWINTRGIREGKLIQNIFTYSKVIILLAFIGIGVYIASQAEFSVFQSSDFWRASKATDGNAEPLHGFGLLAAISVAMVGSIFAADAWYNTTYNADEAINPKKTIPRSLFVGTLVVSVIYLLVNIVYVMALPVKGVPDGAGVVERGIQFASEERVATAVIFGIIGKNAEILVALLVMVSTFGCNNGIILSGARVFYAMAKDKLFFRKTGELSGKGVPAFSLFIQATWSILLVFSGTYSDLLDFMTFAALLFYVLTILAIFVLRKKQPDLERPYKAFGYPVLPIIYIGLCLIIIFFLLIYKPLFTWPGLIIVLSGFPVFYLWRKFGNRKPENAGI